MRCELAGIELRCWSDGRIGRSPRGFQHGTSSLALTSRSHLTDRATKAVPCDHSLLQGIPDIRVGSKVGRPANSEVTVKGNMSALVRRAANRAGFELLRYPQSDPLYGTAQLIRTVGIELVLDVGANDGGYGLSLRRLGYDGRIASFEPTRDAWARLDSHIAIDPNWEAFNLAISDRDGTTEMNVAGNMGHSSSLLPMTLRHTRAAPSSAFVSTEQVECARLDTLAPVIGIRDATTFLKMDVQGGESHVLDGLGEMLEHVVGIQTEMSLTELYSGQILFRDLLDRIEALGFALTGVLSGFTDQSTGRMLQCDGVFFRSDLVG
jgi:FkbM family methyltransferase